MVIRGGAVNQEETAYELGGENDLVTPGKVEVSLNLTFLQAQNLPYFQIFIS